MSILVETFFHIVYRPIHPFPFEFCVICLNKIKLTSPRFDSSKNQSSYINRLVFYNQPFPIASRQFDP